MQMFEVNGVEYKTNEKGNYFYKLVDGKWERIKKDEYEIAFDAYTDQVVTEVVDGSVDPDPEQVEVEQKHTEEEAKQVVLDAGMEKLGYYRIESEWNDIRYSNSAHQVMCWHTVEEGIAWVEENWDTENETKERKAKQEEEDHKTEEAFNKEKKEKKAKKPRKSKDIAFATVIAVDGTEKHITLTKKQVEFLRLLPDTDFWEDGVDSVLWCDCIADDIEWNPMSVGAMISTLREKGLVAVEVQKVNGKKAKCMVFTDLGKAVIKEMGLE